MVLGVPQTPLKNINLSGNLTFVKPIFVLPIELPIVLPIVLLIVLPIVPYGPICRSSWLCRGQDPLGQGPGGPWAQDVGYAWRE